MDWGKDGSFQVMQNGRRGSIRVLGGDGPVPHCGGVFMTLVQPPPSHLSGRLAEHLEDNSVLYLPLHQQQVWHGAGIQKTFVNDQLDE